jgi:flagellar biosynthesis/type III secretory pathway M-ring protein FliF/YscJ
MPPEVLIIAGVAVVPIAAFVLIDRKVFRPKRVQRRQEQEQRAEEREETLAQHAEEERQAFLTSITEKELLLDILEDQRRAY